MDLEVVEEDLELQFFSSDYPVHPPFQSIVEAMSRASTSQSTPQYQRAPSNYNNQAFAPHGNNFAAKLGQQQSRPSLNPQQSAAGTSNQGGVAGQNSRKRKGIMRDGAEREYRHSRKVD